MTTEQNIEKLAVAYSNWQTRTGGVWMRIADAGAECRLTPAEMAEAVRELMTEDDFRAEPWYMENMITDEDRAYEVMIGGDGRHMIAWG